MKALWKNFDIETSYCRTPRGFLISFNGVIMGIYKGRNAKEAVDNLSRDAGYASYDDLQARINS